MDEHGKELSKAEISLHNSDSDLWIIVDDVVYDMSTFDHPGGKKGKSSIPTGLCTVSVYVAGWKKIDINPVLCQC